MYEAFFGLRERPFDLAANPRFIVLTARHRDALSTLRAGLSGPSGLTLLLGEAGTGKSTLVRGALAEQTPHPENLTLLLGNPTLERAEFYEYVAHRLGLTAEAAKSKARFLVEFQELLQARHTAGGLTTVIIDEAHGLPDELLEEVRLLADIETSDLRLLNLVLVGQPELADRLNQPSLRQLKQRVTLRWRLTPLDLREMAVYLAARVRVAGGQAAELFTREAVTKIYEASGGLPRLVNLVCDNSLLSAFAAQVKPVTEVTVRAVCRDFDLGSPLPVAPRPAASRALEAGRDDASPSESAEVWVSTMRSEALPWRRWKDVLTKSLTRMRPASL